jgi:hypothetical protein
MAYFDTLQYVDGSGATQEVALSLANLVASPAVKLLFTPASHAPSTFVITWLQPPENAIAIPFKSRCVVYANRSSAAGAANTFSGGSILFQGRRTDLNGSASATRVMSEITLSDAWWDLQKLTMQMAWRQVTGGTMAAPTFGTVTWPDIVLFQSLPGAIYTPAPVNSTINTWQQITDIINFATGNATANDAVQLQIGSAPEFTPVYCNWYPMRSAKCAEALLACLRPNPGLFTEIDYTTTPPTIHFRNSETVTAMTLPYKATDANGVVHVASEIKRLDDLIPDAVRLFYKITGAYNGQPTIAFATDIYPPSGATNTLLDLDFSIDIAGPSTQETRINFTSVAFDPTSLTLWRQRVASLRQMSEGGQVPNDGGTGALALVSSAPYNAATNPKGIQVVGEDGTDYSTNYAAMLPYLTDQDVYSWFTLPGGAQATAVKATVKAFFAYSKVTSQGGATITDRMAEHQHTFRVLLTTAPPATYVLKQTLAIGESMPAGLAQAIYTDLATPQWSLRHETLQVAGSATAVPTLIKPGKHAVNLSGGAAEWNTMLAMPQRVTTEFLRVLANKNNGTGTEWRLAAHHHISCGPVNSLEPGYLVQLHNLFINRNRSGIDPFQRLSGTTSSSQVDLTSNAPRENSMPAVGVPIENNNVLVVSGAVVGQTIQSAQKVYDILSATTPTPVVDAAGMRTMQPREMPVCDNSGNFFYAIIQATSGHTKS